MGGTSTGPKTAEGRAKCAAVKTVHGRETREKRRMRADKLRELRLMERVMIEVGMIS